MSASPFNADECVCILLGVFATTDPETPKPPGLEWQMPGRRRRGRGSSRGGVPRIVGRDQRQECLAISRDGLAHLRIPCLWLSNSAASGRNGSRCASPERGGDRSADAAQRPARPISHGWCCKRLDRVRRSRRRRGGALIAVAAASPKRCSPGFGPTAERRTSPSCGSSSRFPLAYCRCSSSAFCRAGQARAPGRSWRRQRHSIPRKSASWRATSSRRPRQWGNSVSKPVAFMRAGTGTNIVDR